MVVPSANLAASFAKESGEKRYIVVMTQLVVGFVILPRSLCEAATVAGMVDHLLTVTPLSR